MRRSVNHVRAAMLVVSTLALANIAGTCRFSFDEDDFPGGGSNSGGTQTPLDKASLHIVIDQATPGAAQVVATLRDSRGRSLSLGDGQSIAINGVTIFAAGDGADLTASIAPAANYTVTVTEPTRGVQSTVVSAPPAFSVLSPAVGATVSLAGFTVQWDGVNPGFVFDIAILQTIFGESRSAAAGGSDTGQHSFSASDLATFQQGAPLSLMVRKTNVQTGIAGFASGRADVKWSTTIIVNPGP